jgi:hypothetical protein
MEVDMEAMEVMVCKIDLEIIKFKIILINNKNNLMD